MYPAYQRILVLELIRRIWLLCQQMCFLDLYEKYGSRLLEQNVRCFLQARGKINKGIRTTILTEPKMFFAYNNGITATAQEVGVRKTENGLEIVSIKDLQIVKWGADDSLSISYTQEGQRLT